MTVLLNARGLPEPSPEIQRRLREVHPDLSIRFVNPTIGSWAICLDWLPDDPRRAYVQRGELDPFNTTDIIGYLPMDCPVADAPAYVQQALRAYPKENVQRMADFVAAPNRGNIDALAEAALAEVLDQRDPSKPMTFADAMVNETMIVEAPVKRGPGRPRKHF
jgi:hypothetical protein